jgi:hypothetical protein
MAVAARAASGRRTRHAARRANLERRTLKAERKEPK